VVPEHGVDDARGREGDEGEARHAARAFPYQQAQRRRHQDAVERPLGKLVGELRVAPCEIQAQREAAEAGGEVPPRRPGARDEKADCEREPENRQQQLLGIEVETEERALQVETQPTTRATSSAWSANSVRVKGRGPAGLSPMNSSDIERRHFAPVLSVDGDPKRWEERRRA
jgi:hypothetical protein